MSYREHIQGTPITLDPELERRRQISDAFGRTRGALSAGDIGYLTQFSPINILHILVHDPRVPLEMAVRSLRNFPSERMVSFLQTLADDPRFMRIRTDIDSTLRAIQEA